MQLLEMKAPQTQNCAEHGDYETQLIFRGKFTGESYSQCPKCEAARDEQIKADREKKRMTRYAERVNASGIPLRFRSVGFEEFITTTPAQLAALDATRSYARQFDEHFEKGRCLVLCGRPGTGKTHLANSIAQVILSAPFLGEGWECGSWHRVKYATAPDIIRSIRETWNGNGSEAKTIASYVNPSLLIIDEVGMSAGSESERNLISEIIDKRYQNIEPTIVLSNVASTELKNFLGERAVDRLRENGGQIVVFDWQSHRGSAA